MKRIALLFIFAPALIFGQSLTQLAENNNLIGIINAVNRGANVNEADDGGFTALHVASWNGNVDLVRALLQAGVCISRMHLALTQTLKKVISGCMWLPSSHRCP